MKHKDMKRGIQGIIISIVFLLALIGCSSHDEEKKNVAKAGPVLTFDKAEYIGSDKCKDCHWREHDSWKHTLHSKFVQDADETTVIGDFVRNNKLNVRVTRKAPRLARKKITSTMFIRDGKYYVNTIGPDWEFHDYEITNVIGINRRQTYITKFPNGELHVLPIEWNVDRMVWTDYFGVKKYYPGSGKYWSDTGRMWQLKCGGCHVTGMDIQYNNDTNSFDTSWVDLGIGCEACHGPGSNHVKAAKVYFDKEKDTIINPAKLPWRLRAMVCGQCHNWGMSTTKVSLLQEGFPDRYAFAFGYQPGRSLYLYYTKNPDEEKIHHQQYNEWQESTHSEAGIMCTTCHGVHEEGAHKSPHKSQTRAHGDILCLQCHKTLKRRAAHRIHTFGSCIACHMPNTAGHEHSHTFKFISPEVSIRAGGVDKQPNSCSGCHYHEKTPLENLVEFLDAAKKADMPRPFSAHGR
jgi:hypothetical protein